MRRQDELQQLIAADENFRLAREEILDRHAILDALVAMRKTAGVTQEQMAERMSISQPTVSEFESEQSDPKLSTLQRYARALGARIDVRIDASPTDQVEFEEVGP